MSSVDDLEVRVKRLEDAFARLSGRVSRMENRIEEALDAPPHKVSVVPPSVVGISAQIGEELAEASKSARSAKQSVRNLRRAISPDETTGSHLLEPGHSTEEPFKPDKK